MDRLHRQQGLELPHHAGRCRRERRAHPAHRGRRGQRRVRGEPGARLPGLDAGRGGDRLHAHGLPDLQRPVGHPGRRRDAPPDHGPHAEGPRPQRVRRAGAHPLGVEGWPGGPGLALQAGGCDGGHPAGYLRPSEHSRLSRQRLLPLHPVLVQQGLHGCRARGARQRRAGQDVRDHELRRMGRRRHRRHRVRRRAPGRPGPHRPQQGGHARGEARAATSPTRPFPATRTSSRPG